jgi:hypothetical protein
LKYNNIKNGDLVFVTAQKENLSGAINRVTQKNATENYDHIGIIEKNKNAIFVLHAAPKVVRKKKVSKILSRTNLKEMQKFIFTD